MNNQELIKTLKRADACSDAIKWVGQRDLKTAWAECQRADWMAWGLAQMAGKPGWPTHREIVSIAVYCARRAYRFVEKDLDNSIINCIEAVEAWVKNPCEETRRKVKAADASVYAADAARAAARAAYAAINASVYAADAARAAVYVDAYAANAANAAVYAAADAANAAVYAAADAANAAADAAEHKAICDHIRQTVNIPL